MPNTHIDIPKNSFPGSARPDLVARLNEAAAQAEQIPDEPRKRSLCWVSIEERAEGCLTCGGVDVCEQLLPCIAHVYLPAGVLDETSRARYSHLVHAAFTDAKPASDGRRVLSSVVLHEVPDGQWGANGRVWRLTDFVRAAGFAHLQGHAKAPA